MGKFEMLCEAVLKDVLGVDSDNSEKKGIPKCGIDGANFLKNPELTDEVEETDFEKLSQESKDKILQLNVYKINETFEKKEDGSHDMTKIKVQDECFLFTNSGNFYLVAKEDKDIFITKLNVDKDMIDEDELKKVEGEKPTEVKPEVKPPVEEKKDGEKKEDEKK